jgi:molecular chaperone DnaJ
MTSPDPYAILHVPHDASDEVIATAYRALARKHHPDLAGDASTGSMSAINAAWELLGTKRARAAYERERQAPLRTVLPSDPTPEQARAVASTPGFVPLPDGTGAAGRPPGKPSGSILPFGRHLGWSLGEVAKADPGYLEWLEEKPLGRPYLAEIAAILERLGRRAPKKPVTSPSGAGRWLRF